MPRRARRSTQPLERMTTHRTLPALAALALGVAASWASPGPTTHRGEYFYNFENAYFTVDGSEKECWASKGDMSKARAPIAR